MDNVPFIVPLAVYPTGCAAIVVAGFVEHSAIVVGESVPVPDKDQNAPHHSFLSALNLFGGSW